LGKVSYPIDENVGERGEGRDQNPKLDLKSLSKGNSCKSGKKFSTQRAAGPKKCVWNFVCWKTRKVFGS
jgi:hypothetical protein